MVKKVLTIIALVFFSLSQYSSSLAALRQVAIKPRDISKITVTVMVKKKAVQKSISCYRNKGGQARKTAGKYSFKSFSALISEAKRNKSKKSTIDLYKQLKTASDIACKEVGGVPAGSLPDYLSLERYTGTFGEEQARTLFDRFAFSAPPARIQQAVQDGLSVTIDKLTTFVPEPGLDAAEANMRCNGLLPGDVRNGTPNYACDLTNPNDIDMGGLKTAIIYKMWYSQNNFHHNLFFFLHNRFQSVNTRVLNGCNAWSAIPYIDLVRRAAIGGNYVQFLKEFGSDYFAAVNWLHLKGSTKDKPNEDEAREILQLGGTGAVNLDGSPVYSDYDIAQNALALSGWVETSYTDDNDHRICVPAFSTQLHAPGPEKLFSGTPYESQISNLDDVVAAIARHPRLAERISENIFDEYINPFATPAAIRNLASLVRSNNYNLIPVLKTVMASKALYAPKSYKSIPKQPLEYMLGFLRITGMPITGDYYTLGNLADDIGQVPLSPGTVFGWTNRDGLAGESYVLERRNVVVYLLGQSIDDLRKKGFTYWDHFLNGIAADGNASTQFINRLQSWFNVKLNPAQVAVMKQFLDYDQRTCNQYTHCAAGQQYYLERDQFDPAVDSPEEGRATETSTIYSNKTRGAIAMMAMMPDFMMK